MCFLNQWVQKRKRSVVSGSRQKPGSRAGGGWLPAGPALVRAARRCARASGARAAGGRRRGCRRRTGSTGRAARPRRSPVGRGVGGGGRAGSWGSPALRPPSACRKAQSGHLTTRINKEAQHLQGHRTAGVRPGAPSHARLTSPSSASSSSTSSHADNRLPRAPEPLATVLSSGVLAMGHPLRMPTIQPRKGAGIAFLPLGRGAE